MTGCLAGARASACGLIRVFTAHFAVASACAAAVAAVAAGACKCRRRRECANGEHSCKRHGCQFLVHLGSLCLFLDSFGHQFFPSLKSDQCKLLYDFDLIRTHRSTGYTFFQTKNRDPATKRGVSLCYDNQIYSLPSGSSTGVSSSVFPSQEALP